jgi:hypothetical protein
MKGLLISFRIRKLQKKKAVWKTKEEENLGFFLALCGIFANFWLIEQIKHSQIKSNSRGKKIKTVTNPPKGWMCRVLY